MKLIAEWWCTEVMNGPAAYLRRASDIPAIIAGLKQKRSCIQAGGHIGIYGRALAEAFDYVYVFEPEAENFSCLVRNLEGYLNVYPLRAFLSDRHGGHDLRYHRKCSGGHSIGNGGAIPTFCIDDLALEDCDCIFLDVEGTEHAALRGALKTIARCKPRLVLEENKKAHNRGHVAGDLEKLVAPFGYRLTHRYGEDIVLESPCPPSP